MRTLSAAVLLLAAILTPSPAGAQSTYPTADPSGGATWYLANPADNGLYPLYVRNAMNAAYPTLAANAPTKNANDVVQFFAVPSQATRNLLMEWYTPKLLQGGTVQGALRIVVSLYCDTHMQDVSFRIYLAKVGAAGGPSVRGPVPFDSKVYGGSTAQSTLVMDQTFQVTTPYPLKAGERLGIYFYGAGTGDPLNCFLFMNSRGNPGFITFPYTETPAAAPPPAPKIEISVQPDADAARGEANVSVAVKNAATGSDNVTLRVDDVPDGWTARFVRADTGESAERTTLAAGAVADIVLRLTNATAPGSYTLRVNVTSSLGYNASYPTTIRVPQPPAPATPTPTGTSAAPTNGTSDPAIANDTRVLDEPGDGQGVPGPAMVWLVVALAAACVLLRRRGR